MKKKPIRTAFPNIPEDESSSINTEFDSLELSKNDSLEPLATSKVLSLRSRGLRHLPNGVLSMRTLTRLDLSDNCLVQLPPEICHLVNLRDLNVDKNRLSVLPAALWDLGLLAVLRVAVNRLTVPPDRPNGTKMRIPDDPLTNLNLRANRLKGNIILGNYGNLTELDVSENSIEHLDLGALSQLQILQCSRNRLTRLTLHGKCLVSIIAGNNRLTSLVTAESAPVNLRHLDVSYNQLEQLPDWLTQCRDLRTLFATNNKLTQLPQNFFRHDLPHLTTLQLASNQLQQLPPILKKIPIQELFLQNNSLPHLPDAFFTNLCMVRVLNMSNNRLVALPSTTTNLHHLEKLFLTANCLTDASLVQIAPYLSQLKVLHVAYNNLTNLPDLLLRNCTELEELVLSGNRLLDLPSDFGDFLPHLQILRAHSNLLQTVPSSCLKLNQLRILDLAHNQLSHIDLEAVVPSALKFLDVSCNPNLYVDACQFDTYRQQRALNLIDVSGRNRHMLPVAPPSALQPTNCAWSVGFAETAGHKQRLYVNQLRVPVFGNSTEGLFGIVDGEDSYVTVGGVEKSIPRLLLEQRTNKETSDEYLKYTLVNALKSERRTANIRALVCHVMKLATPTNRYRIAVGSTGNCRLVVGNVGNCRVLPIEQKAMVTTSVEQLLNEHDEFLILANKSVWDVLTPEGALRECHLLQGNVILAAKRLQDLAQSYGAEENLSILIVRLLPLSISITNRNCSTCCTSNVFESRSSPSGQSEEHCCSDCNSSSAKLFVSQHQPESSQTNNNNDSDSALSEEQFKCWEYMLEQNTQLLFDKELKNTLKGGKCRRTVAARLSRSTPNIPPVQTVQNFATGRTFNPLVRPAARLNGVRQKLGGGPHAAYFGSLQRLMPYNLEYDLAVMHDRGLADSVELDRMQQYWGVATTEL